MFLYRKFVRINSAVGNHIPLVYQGGWNDESQTKLYTSYDGRVSFNGLEYIKDRNGELITMNRTGVIQVSDMNGRERAIYPVAYGANLMIKDGSLIKNIGKDEMNIPDSSKPITVRCFCGALNGWRVTDNITGGGEYNNAQCISPVVNTHRKLPNIDRMHQRF